SFPSSAWERRPAQLRRATWTGARTTPREHKPAKQSFARLRSQAELGNAGHDGPTTRSLSMSDTVNRRDFLTAGAATAGALAFSGGLFAQGSNTINVGIIGCGGRGGGALINVLEADRDVKITALCDLHENKAKGALAN